MATLEFEDLRFMEEKDQVKVEFIKNYYFYLDKEDLGDYKITENSITIDKKRFNILLEKGFQQLKNKLRNKPTIYIHKNSGIPLIGSNEFGLVDRDTNIIEVKPNTGCNLSCIFCSVSEGDNKKKDIVIEEEYLVEEFNKIAKIKKHPVEAHINPQGEPLIYPKIIQLITDLKKISRTVSINTNGLLLNKNLVDELIKAGLDRINISIHSLDEKMAKKLANTPYNIKKILEIIRYCENKIDILLAPVIIPGYNEEDLDKIVELAKKIKNKKYPTLGIQNFLNYKGGRNITKQKPMEEFYELLKEKQKQHNIKLIIKEQDNPFQLYEDTELEKPFKKNDIIKAEIKSDGRNPNEKIAVANNRNITVINCEKKGTVKIKIIRSKHNIYKATLTK
jgi:uncharacterized Fe-S cluster-containing radical SAM superfamily enzyme